jgi:hypothetical protein
MQKYIVYEENNPLLSRNYKSISIAIHEIFHLFQHSNYNNFIIEIIQEEYDNHTIFPLMLEKLKISKDLIVSLEIKGIFFDLKNENQRNYFFDEECNILCNRTFTIKNKFLAKNLSNTKTQIPTNNKSDIKKNDENIDQSSKNILSNILKKINNNTGSLIENQNNDNEENNNANEEYPEYEIEKLRSNIEKMEKAKQMTEEAIGTFETELNNEETNLTKYIENYNEENKMQKREDEKINRDISVFTSEKEYTYKKIYNTMKISGGISFKKIPPLFISKFPVFLFMDGKDCEGNDVRKRLLDTDDEYRIFNLLHNSLTDENFDEFEDNNDAELVYQFMDFLPNGYQAISPIEIMEHENKKNDNVLNVMFKEKETDQEECTNNESNDAYSMPSY